MIILNRLIFSLNNFLNNFLNLLDFLFNGQLKSFCSKVGRNDVCGRDKFLFQISQTIIREIKQIYLNDGFLLKYNI